MRRRLTLAAALVLLPGCYDFTGDFDRIGFTSNLEAGPGVSWTPELAIAAGSRATFAAVDRVDTDEDEAPDVVARATGGLDTLPDEPGAITVMGPGRGRLHFEGEVDDTFAVVFKPAREARVYLGAEGLLGRYDTDGAAAVLLGERCPIGVSLHDGRGRALGHEPERISVAGDPGLAVYPHDRGPLELKGTLPGHHTLEVAYTDAAWEVEGFRVVTLDEIVALELTVDVLDFEGEEHVVVNAVGETADGWPVHCLPVDWQVPEGAESHGAVAQVDRHMLKGTRFSAHLDGLHATLDVADALDP